MKKELLIIALLFCIICSHAQENKVQHYLQFAVGPTFYSGEIGGSATGISVIDLWNWKDPRSVISVGYKAMLNKRLSLKASLSYMKLAGNDIKAEREIVNQRSFESYFFEAGANIEFNLLNNYFNNDNTHQLYLFTGVGSIFNVNVDFMGNVYGGKFDAKPDPAIYVPVGIGYQMNFDRVSLGLEIFGQYTTSDYLDAFQFAQSAGNDFVFGSQFTIAFRIGKDCSTCYNIYW